jgi:hypothetical protein
MDFEKMENSIWISHAITGRVFGMGLQLTKRGRWICIIQKEMEPGLKRSFQCSPNSHLSNAIHFESISASLRRHPSAINMGVAKSLSPIFPNSHVGNAMHLNDTAERLDWKAVSNWVTMSYRYLSILWMTNPVSSKSCEYPQQTWRLSWDNLVFRMIQAWNSITKILFDIVSSKFYT